MKIGGAPLWKWVVLYGVMWPAAAIVICVVHAWPWRDDDNHIRWPWQKKGWA